MSCFPTGDAARPPCECRLSWRQTSTVRHLLAGLRTALLGHVSTTHGDGITVSSFVVEDDKFLACFMVWFVDATRVQENSDIVKMGLPGNISHRATYSRKQSLRTTYVLRLSEP